MKITEQKLKKIIQEEIQEVFGLKNPFKKKQAPKKQDNPVLLALEDKLGRFRVGDALGDWHNKDGYDDVRQEIITLTKYIDQSLTRRGKSIKETPKLLSALALATLQAMRSKDPGGAGDRDQLDALKKRYMKDVT